MTSVSRGMPPLACRRTVRVMADDGMSGDEARQRMSWGVGIALGMGVGVAMGVALGNIGMGIGIGLAIGIAFSAAFGAATDSKPKDSDDTASEEGVGPADDIDAEDGDPGSGR